MKTFTVPLRGERGSSLIEVLIALALTGIVTLAIMNTYVIQHENYLVQDDVTTMQQSARSCIDELTRQVRMAGHHLPLGLSAIVASNTNPDTITVTYHGNDCETYLSAAMANTSVELTCGSDVSCFSDNQWVYIWEPDSAKGEWFTISHVTTASNTIQHSTAALSRKYGASSQILALNRVKFYVDQTTDLDNPKLMVQVNNSAAQPYADHVTDLQFRYHLDNGSTVDVPVLITDIREVQIDITAGSNMVQAEGDGSEVKDRMYSSSVNLRNIGL
jgi:Tfp pilus assembly protein PilW